MTAPPLRELPDDLGSTRLLGGNALLLGAPYVGQSTRLEALADRREDLAVVGADHGGGLADARALPGEVPVVVDDFALSYRRADADARAGLASWLDREAPVCLSTRPREFDRLLDPAATHPVDPAVLDRVDAVVFLRYDPDRSDHLARATGRCIEVASDRESPVPGETAVADRLARTAHPGYEFRTDRIRAWLDGESYPATLVPAVAASVLGDHPPPDFPDGWPPAHGRAAGNEVGGASGDAVGSGVGYADPGSGGPGAFTDWPTDRHERALREADPDGLGSFYATCLERLATEGHRPPTWCAGLLSDLVERTAHAADPLCPSREARADLVGRVAADVVHLAAWDDAVEGGLLDDAVEAVTGVEPADPALFGAVVDRVATRLAGGTTADWLRSGGDGSRSPDLSAAREAFLVGVYERAIAGIASEGPPGEVLGREDAAARLDDLEDRVAAVDHDGELVGRVARRAALRVAGDDGTDGEGSDDDRPGDAPADLSGWLSHFLGWNLAGEDVGPVAVYESWIDHLAGEAFELVPLVARDAAERVQGDDRLGGTPGERADVGAGVVAATVQAVWLREFDLDNRWFRAVVEAVEDAAGPPGSGDLVDRVATVLEETHDNPLAAHEWERAFE